MSSKNKSLVSIITPAYNEEQNLPVFYERLSKTLEGTSWQWEWIVVDDHSSDNTFLTVSQLSKTDDRVKGVRLARNSGSHRAVRCGLELSRGDCAVVMAADLQDPPEEIVNLIDKWQEEFQVVWAVRRAREGEKSSTLGFSRFYYWLMRNLAGLREMPATGADFFLIDRKVVKGLLSFPELNTSIFALLIWMGFRQTSIFYDKKARLYGQSGWTLRKKLKLVVDSITCFSFLPIRFLSLAGIFSALLGLGYALFIFIRAFGGVPVEGWASLMIAILVIGGLQMLMIGVLGEYIWRNLEETRRRPPYLIEGQTGLTKHMDINTTD